jgi:hypothetical protein
MDIRVCCSPSLSLWQGTAHWEPRGTLFPEDLQIDSLGHKEASLPSPTPKTFLGPLLPFALLCPFPLPFPRGQRAEEPICYQPHFSQPCLLWISN